MLCLANRVALAVDPQSTILKLAFLTHLLHSLSSSLPGRR